MPAKNAATIDIEALVLQKGAHRSAAEGMCIMEAVAYVAGEPFSDHPSCASPVNVPCPISARCSISFFTFG